jgi:hypothetical protein
VSDFEKPFLAGRPSWRELKRFSEKIGGVSSSIVSYCERLYDTRASARESTAAEVLEFITQCEPVRDFLTNELKKRNSYAILSDDEEELI